MRLVMICALAVLAAAAVALAAPPATMSYQGVLRDDLGNVVPDGTYQMEFTIYDSETAGNTLWAGSKHVAVTDGIFDVILGSDTPLDIPFDARYWLGIAVEGEPELTPRVELTAAPYARRAAVADSIEGGLPGDTDWTESGGNVYRTSGNVGIGTSSPSHDLDVQGSAHAGQLHFYEMDGIMATLSTLSASAVYVSSQFDLPSGAADGHVLTSDAYGQGTWQPAPGVTPPGSSGDIIFNDGGSLGATPNLYYDAVNDRLGIGTNSPVTDLDVDGHARMSNLTVANTVDASNVMAPTFSLSTGQITDLTVSSVFTLSDSPVDGYVLTSDASGNGTWQPAPTGIGGSGTSNYVPRFSSSTTLTNSVVYDDGSSVGIGTTTPSATLDVAGSLSVADDISANVATGSAPISVRSTTVCGNLNSDLHDGYHAGNASGEVAVSNGMLCTDLNADQLDGYDVGGQAGDIPLNNWSHNIGLDADMVDGRDAGNTSGDVAVNNGTVCTDLNADMVDGKDLGSLHYVRESGTVWAGNTETIAVPHYTTWTLELAAGHPAQGGVCTVTGFENDRMYGVTYQAYNGDGTSTQAGAEAAEFSTDTLVTFGSGSYVFTVTCPGEDAGDHNIVLDTTGSIGELRYRLIY
ncbi:MAG: hypothetical protein GF405_08925 [Candidatus Eisenbacteria bacterium]|nr:hypothetical protein [Candidatus Eisenbacteria bacterium]